MLSKVSAVVLWSLAVLVVVLAGYLAVRGAGHLSLGYLFTAPEALGTAGGIDSMLWNTLIIVAAALALAVPVALAGAIAYAAGGLRRALYRTLIDVGVAVPHLLWGLGGAALLGEGLGWGYSAATGVVTLACLLTPILVSAFVDGLTGAGAGVLPAARALGLPEWRVWVSYVLPRARPALLAACLLASGRACGDAAALYFTAGLGMRFLTDWDQSASTLAVHVLKLAVDVAGGQDAAFAAAFVLLCLTALIQLPLLILSTNPKGADHA